MANVNNEDVGKNSDKRITDINNILLSEQDNFVKNTNVRDVDKITVVDT